MSDPECIHCQAVDDDYGVTVRVEQNSGGYYTVCNICEPPEGDQ